jgi:hypothetical protein
VTDGSKTTYVGDLRRLILGGLLVMIAGIGGSVGSTSALLAWVKHRGFPTHLQLIVFAPLFPFLIWVGLVILVRAKRGYRIELAPQRITIYAARGERWADWCSLGEFTPVRRKKTVTAGVIGQNASANLLRAGELTISAFLVHMDENILAEQLNNMRENASSRATMERQLHHPRSE